MKVSASLYRRLVQANNDKNVQDDIFVGAVEDLIELAKMEGHGQKNGAELCPLELLAELQHYGAATCFIDFTKNPLIALWFTCESDPKRDGEVFALSIRNEEKLQYIQTTDLDKEIGKLFSPTKLWIWPPKKQNNRIVAQQSVFVFGKSVISEETENMVSCEISGQHKQEILEELRRMGISAESLFCDFDGFARQNGAAKPYRALLALYLNRADACAEKQDWQGAVKYYTHAIGIDRHNPAYYFSRGIARGNLGNRQGAIEDFSKAIEFNPNDAVAYYNRGIAKGRLGDHQPAIEDFSKAIELNPKYAEAYNNRGVDKGGLGERQAAIEDFSKAIEFNPNDALAYNNRGVDKNGLGKHQAAIKDYNKAIELNPDYASAYYNRGNAKSDLGEYQPAIEDLNKAIELNPKYAAAYYNRGVAKDNSGDHAGAKADFEEANRLDPKLKIPAKYRE